MKQKQNPSSFLYNLLWGGRYRVLRHVFLIGILVLIGLNQVYILYGRFHFSALWVTLAYLFAVYLNIYVLIPRFLFTKKYLVYGLAIVLSAVGLIGILDLIEWVVFLGGMESFPEKSGILSAQVILQDLFLSFPLSLVSVGGAASLSMLRQWRIENRRISHLQKEFLESELEQLKERITPDFLFQVLHQAGHLAETHPEEASRMLVGLSRVLRYQLYDCARDEVLVSSELIFLRNYLDLYRFCVPSFQYRMTVNGTVDRIFIPPLLFLPLIQILIRKSSEVTELHMEILLSEESICFIGSVGASRFESIEMVDLSDIRKRLEFLYGSVFQLSVYDKRIFLQLNNSAYDH